MIGNDILYKKSYLQQNVDQDCDEGEGQVEDQPDCYRLDVRGDGQTGGHWEVDGGEDHHAGDVDGVDHAVLVLSTDVVCGLVDRVHEDGGQVGLHENAGDLPC